MVDPRLDTEVQYVDMGGPDTLPEQPKQVVQKARVHKTKAPVREETINYLTGWRVPNYAYVLFEKVQRHFYSEEIPDPSGETFIDKDGKERVKTQRVTRSRWGTGLATLNIENRPERFSTMEQWIRKGFRVIDYGNFPSLDHPSAVRRSKASFHKDQYGNCSWDKVKRWCDQQMSGEAHKQKEFKALANQNEAMEAKIRELEEKLGSTDADKNKQNTKSSSKGQSKARDTNASG